MRLADFRLDRQQDEDAWLQPQPVRVIAVTGGKGGTGKSSIAVNLAQALANGGRRTMLLDADLAMANVDVLLGLEAQFTLFDVIEGRCDLQDTLLTAASGLQVIPAGSGVRRLADLGASECAGLVRAFSAFSGQVDTLVIDTASGISGSVAGFCRAATDVLVVVCNEPAAIRDSGALITMLSHDYGIRRFHLLASRVSGRTEGLQLFDTLQARLSDQHELLVSYAGYIPHDKYLSYAIADHSPVVNAYPKSPSARAIRRLATGTLSWPRPEAAGGHLEFFVERLIQNDKTAMEVAS